MQYRLLDKSVEECSIIENVLDKYCIPYRVEEKRQIIPGLFSSVITTYDIIINMDLKPESIKFIEDKIKEVQSLEDCYNLEYEEEYKKSTDIFDSLSCMFRRNNEEEKQEISFNKLDKTVKRMLLDKFPESVLKSKNCKIYKHRFGYSISIIG